MDFSSLRMRGLQFWLCQLVSWHKTLYRKLQSNECFHEGIKDYDCFVEDRRRWIFDHSKELSFLKFSVCLQLSKIRCAMLEL